MNLLSEIFAAFCDASWRASCLIALFLVIRPIVRGRIATRLLVWAWIAVAVRLVIPVSVPTGWSPFGSPLHGWLPTTTVGQVIPAASAEGGMLDAASADRGAASMEKTPGPVEPGSGTISLQQWAAVIWLGGVVILACARLVAVLRFRHALQRYSGAPDPALRSLVAGIGADLGMQGCKVLITDLVAVPAVHGLLRPRLLFPPRFTERLDPKELPFVIAHELGHCRHRDLLSHALIRAAQILHWFNPLVWFAGSAAKHDCEIACDEFALRQLKGANRSDYGAALLKVVGSLRHAQALPAALAIIDSKKHLKRRIRTIIAFHPASLGCTLVGAASLALVAGAAMTRQSMAQEPSSAAVPSIATETPSGWWKNGSKVAAYVVGVDRTQTHNGSPSAYVKSMQPSIDGFGGMMQMCSADDYRGKRLRFSAWMKTQDANDKGAHLWFRVDGAERGQMLQFDNMDNRPVMGTTDWREYAIVLDVPSSAKALAYGFFIHGTGQAWVSGIKLEEVGPDVPTTDVTSGTGRELPRIPVNLGFE
jgi:beta-lactamase regulating signal transducer with metallopeptidase domain